MIDHGLYTNDGAKVRSRSGLSGGRNRQHRGEPQIGAQNSTNSETFRYFVLPEAIWAFGRQN